MPGPHIACLNAKQMHESMQAPRQQPAVRLETLLAFAGEVRAHYHDAQEGLAMLEGDRQDAVKKMEEAAMKLRIETRESDNLREDVKAGLKRIGELEAEVERLERLEAAACQAQKRAMEMGAEKFFKHRQGWRQIIETVGRINEGVSILKGETTGSLDCLREVCEGFFKRCELRMVELARYSSCENREIQGAAAFTTSLRAACMQRHGSRFHSVFLATIQETHRDF
eukprot:evm.model.scf_504EXC.8 EVM.evm.TU.scf_504EXC.8   scf_504EXC:82778-83455(-)